MSRNVINYTIFILFICLIGCNNDSGLTPETKQSVNGKVYNHLREAIPNINVKIGEQSILTSSDGSFLLNNISVPYDLILLDSLHKYGYYFENLTLPNPELNILNTTFNSHKCFLNVSIPQSVPVSSGKLIFTDTMGINEYMDITSHNSTFNINLMDNKPVTGKLIVLLYSVDQNGHIISYDNFGYKDNITVSDGGNYNINFLSGELTLKPGISNINGTTSFVYHNAGRYFYLNFGKKTYHTFSGDMEFEGFFDARFDFNVPTNLPLKYTTIFYMSGIIDTFGFSGTYSRDFVIPNGGSGYVITIEDPPVLNYPIDRAIGIDENTNFNFYSNLYNASFGIMVSDSVTHYVYYYYTSQLSFNLKWLKKIHNIDLSDKSFLWQVESVTLPFTNLDVYLNPDIYSLNKFEGYSAVFHFKTKP